MSNALTQNATNLAVSPADGPEGFNFNLSVKRQAERQLPKNGLTIYSMTIGRSKLIAGVCQDFKSHFPSLYDKKDGLGNKIPAERLDEATYNKVLEAVDTFIAEEFSKFTGSPDDNVKTTSRFVHRSNKKDAIVRHTIQRDETISLKRQHFALDLFVGETKRQMDKYINQSSVLSQQSEERLQKLQKRLNKEEESLASVDLQIASLKEVVKPE